MELQYQTISLNNPSYIETLDVSPNGKYLVLGQQGDFAGGAKGNLTLLSLPDLELLAEIERRNYETIGCVRFTNDSKELFYITASLSKSQEIYCYHLENQELTVLPSFSEEIPWIAAAKDSPRIVTSGRTVEVWQTNPFQNIFRSVGGHLAQSGSDFAPAALTPDGKHLAVTGINNEQVLIYDVDRQVVIRTLSGAPSKACWAAFSPDSQYLAVICKTSKRAIYLWNLQENIETPKFRTFFSTYLALRFHPHGEYLAGATWSGCIDILQLSDGESIALEDVHKGRIYDLAFTADGSKIFSGGDDGLLGITELVES